MSEKSPRKLNPSFWLSLFFVVIIGVWIVAAAQWRWDTRLFPWAVGIPAFILALCQLITDWRGTGAEATEEGGEKKVPQGILDIALDASIAPEEVTRHTVRVSAWLLAFGCSIWFLGFLISIPIFIYLYLVYEAKASKVSALTVTGLTLLFVWALFDQTMHMAWPEATILTLLGY